MYFLLSTVQATVRKHVLLTLYISISKDEIINYLNNIAEFDEQSLRSDDDEELDQIVGGTPAALGEFPFQVTHSFPTVYDSKLD